MDAMLYPIQDRSRLGDAYVANLDHFTLGEGEAVSSQMVVDEPAWTPYCLEHEQRRVIFVNVDPEVDLSDAVFSHLKQYHTARRVLIVPYAALEDLAAQIDPPQKLIFNFNMARCGTTLAHRILNRVDGVWNLSEADVYSNVAFLRSAGAASDAELVHLLRVCTPLLFRPPAGTQPHTLGVKFRSQLLFSADLVYRAFPEAIYIFMYRDAASWANSFYRFLRRYAIFVAYDDQEDRKRAWSILSNGLSADYLKPFVDFQADAVYPDQLFAPAWILHLETYLKYFESGIPFFALRYNELNRDREMVTRQLLEHCGLPVSALPDALQAFEVDAQQGSDIARDRAVDSFTDENYNRLLEMLRNHPRFNSPDLLLPDIYHLERHI